MYFFISLNEDVQLVTDSIIKSEFGKKSERKCKIKVMCKDIIQEIIGEKVLFLCASKFYLLYKTNLYPILTLRGN